MPVPPQSLHWLRQKRGVPAPPPAVPAQTADTDGLLPCSGLGPNGTPHCVQSRVCVCVCDTLIQQKLPSSGIDTNNSCNTFFHAILLSGPDSGLPLIPLDDGPGLHPPPHMTCLYPPLHLTCMCPHPHMTSCDTHVSSPATAFHHPEPSVKLRKKNAKTVSAFV